MFIRSLSGAVVALVGLLAAAHADTQPVQTVAHVDLDRYLGDWHEIARYPNWFQKKCLSDVVASYSTRDDGRIRVINRCTTSGGSVTEAEGVARVVDPKTNAKLKVRFAPAALSFLPFVWGDYWIVGLAGDYTWAVVGSPDRNYLWILARTPRVDEKTYEAALDAARAQGYDTRKLVTTR